MFKKILCAAAAFLGLKPKAALAWGVATIGAIIIQEIPEAVAVMIFYVVGEFLQSRAINHSRNSIICKKNP